MTDFTPTTMLTGNRFKDDPDPLWLMTPDELASLPAYCWPNCVAIECITGASLTVTQGDSIAERELTDTQRLRFPDGLQLTVTAWGIRGSQLSSLNAAQPG